jgi:hypothetical protein
MAREGIEPPTRGFSGRPRPIRRELRRTIRHLPARPYGRSIAAQRRPEPSKNAEFRYYSGTGSAKKSGQSVPRRGRRWRLERPARHRDSRAAFAACCPTARSLAWPSLGVARAGDRPRAYRADPRGRIGVAGRFVVPAPVGDRAPEVGPTFPAGLGVGLDVGRATGIAGARIPPTPVYRQ